MPLEVELLEQERVGVTYELRTEAHERRCKGTRVTGGDRREAQLEKTVTVGLCPWHELLALGVCAKDAFRGAQYVRRAERRDVFEMPRFDGCAKEGQVRVPRQAFLRRQHVKAR